MFAVYLHRLEALLEEHLPPRVKFHDFCPLVKQYHSWQVRDPTLGGLISDPPDVPWLRAIANALADLLGSAAGPEQRAALGRLLAARWLGPVVSDEIEMPFETGPLGTT